MFVKWIIFCLGCLIAGAKTEDSCHNWKHHKNYHLLHSGDDCGQTKIKPILAPRILNGISATPGSLPWMAFVLIYQVAPEKSFGCGGTVINENYILTAGHCLDKINPKIGVVLGLHNKVDFKDNLDKMIKVANYTIHPEYDNETIFNDIALLRLERSISFESPYINYICLPTSCELAQKDFLGKYLRIAGWGLVSHGHLATTLQSVRVPVKECDWEGDEEMLSVLFESESGICTGGTRSYACKGDSGGPLVYQTAGRAVQVGIVSRGTGNCSSSDDDDPFTFYMKVSSYMDWILDSIEE